LSAGGQGTVYQGRDLSTNKEIAIKRVVCSNINEANYALQEAIAIKNVKHSNIVEYNDVFLEDIGEGAWGICLVMEYYQKGDLSGLLKKRASGEKKKYVPVRTVVSYLLQIVSALEFLHSMKIMHRDIKPRTFLTLC
jgi:serine/threonine protein kinase